MEVQTINLICLNYAFCNYNVEKIRKETGKHVNVICVPRHYNDAGMTILFQEAFPSIPLDYGKRDKSGKFIYFNPEYLPYFRTDKGKYEGWGKPMQLSFNDVTIVGREVFQESVEPVASSVYNQINSLLKPNAPIIIDISSFERRKGYVENPHSGYIRERQIHKILKKLTDEHSCYVFYTYCPDMKFCSNFRYSWTEETLDINAPLIKIVYDLDFKSRPSVSVTEAFRLYNDSVQACLIEYIKKHF